MDTRTKIIDTARAAAAAASGATVVSGYFDPLTAPVAERLARIKQAGVPLLVLIRTPSNAILSARARAELVAGLAVVDYVSEDSESEDGDKIQPTISLEAEHTRNLAELTAHVHARQKAAS